MCCTTAVWLAVLAFEWACGAAPTGHIVHVVPLTHIDPGWRFTFDEHYNDVKKILKPVLLELLVGPNRTFAWEGAAYLTRWLVDHEHAALDDFERRKAPKSRLPQVRPPWSQEETRTVGQRVADACSPFHGPLVLGTGSCRSTCLHFLNASFLGARLRDGDGGGKGGHRDSLLCPSWSGLARYLVRVGQLDIVGGGWVSHDEALSSVSGIVNQLTLGRRSLLALGMNGPVASACPANHSNGPAVVAPSVSWQVDTFGMSASTAKLFLDIGYAGHVGNRLSASTKKHMAVNRELEFIWKLTEARACSGLLTTILDDHYAAPFDFETAKPVSRRSRLPPRAAVKEAVSILSKTLRSRAANHRTPLQMLPMGNDLRFLGSGAAHRHFAYLDAFVAQANSREVNDPCSSVSISLKPQEWSVAYSTPTRYMAALSAFTQCAIRQEDKQFNTHIRSKDGTVLPIRHHEDFFPYSESFNNDWSGFFGSRPVLKHLVRRLEASQASSEAAFALALLHSSDHEELYTNSDNCLKTRSCLDQRVCQSSIQTGREASALLLHHDAITGTCRESVARNYMGKGQAARRAAERVIVESLDNLIFQEESMNNPSSDDFGEIPPKSQDEADWRMSQSRRQLEFHIFNSLADPRTSVVALKAKFACGDAWVVYGPSRNLSACRYPRKGGGDYIPSQMGTKFLVDGLISEEYVFGAKEESCELLVELPLAGLEVVSLFALPVSFRYDDDAYRHRAIRSTEKFIDIERVMLRYNWAPFQRSQSLHWPFSGSTCNDSTLTNDAHSVHFSFVASPLPPVTSKTTEYSVKIELSYETVGSTGSQRETLSTELREYVSSNGVGPKWGWVGSGGAYVFRSMLSAFFGLGIVAVLANVTVLVLAVPWQWRRKMPMGAPEQRASSTHNKIHFFVRVSKSCGIVVLLSSAYFGHWLAKEALRGRYDWLVFEKVHPTTTNQPASSSFGYDKLYRDDDEEKLELNNEVDATWARDVHQARLSRSPESDSASRDAQSLAGALVVAPAAAIFTLSALAIGGFVGGAAALPCAALTFALTCTLSPDYQSRPLSGSLGADKIKSLSLLLSEGPLASSLYYAVGKGEHRTAQAYITRRYDWQKMSVIEMVTSVTAPVGHEIVSRLYSPSSPVAEFSFFDRVRTAFEQMIGLPSACELSTDDGLIQSQPIRSNPWIPLSANFHPVRSTTTVSCAAKSRSDFTLIPFAPTGARATSSSSGVEVMLHRSFAVDDEKGLGEPLLDQSRAELHHLLVLGPQYDSESSTGFAVRQRHLALSFFNPVAISKAKQLSDYPKRKRKSFSWQALQPGFILPKSVSLVSLQWWSIKDDFPQVSSIMNTVRHEKARKALFLRFQHMDNAPEHTSEEVDLRLMFRLPSGLILCSVRETHLDFNPKLSSDESTVGDNTDPKFALSGAKVLRLAPGELRAVVLSFCATESTYSTQVNGVVSNG